MAPIEKLNDDILWVIFTLNANLGDIPDPADEVHDSNQESSQLKYRYSPLTITRRTSQVCTRWRYLILASSAIWRGLIHLDVFNQKRHHWKLEVLRRSGRSPLTVKGNVIGLDVAEFFDYLLQDRWTRIKRLDVWTQYSLDPESDAWVRPLSRRAPFLEFFSLRFHPLCTERLTLDEKLFGNFAPALREFHSMNVELSPLSSWIVQLRHLTLSTPLSWTKTLTALENMKQLESLRIQTNPYDEEKSLPIPTPRHINLPCLRMLSLDGPLGDVMQVLSSIGGVSEECGLFLKLSGLTASTITSVEDSLGSCVSSFQHFCRVYAKESGPKSLFLWIDRHNVLFYDREDVVPSLGYRAEASSSESIVPLLPFLSRTIMTYPIMHTTHLELILHLPSDSIPEELLKFLLAFVSLDTMKITDMATLRAISGLQREHNNLFPSLSTIKFDIWDKMNVPLIQEYLDQRRSIGALVKCLDLTSFTGSLYSVGDLTALEQFPGMRIIWPDEEKAADDDFI